MTDDQTLPTADDRVVDVDPDDITSAAEAIDGHVRATPFIEVSGREFGVDPGVHSGVEVSLVIKLEYLQSTGSFKARGATHYVRTQPISDGGIVAASGGNHGAAVAWAAGRSGRTANIFVPTTSSRAKIDRLRAYGAIVHEVGDVYADALAASREYLSEHDATSIHAYDDPVVMAGAGTCARELDLAAPDLDAVMVACGGGGLVGSTAAWYQDRVEVVAVETFGTATYAAAIEAGAPVDVKVSGLAADALGATRIGAYPFRALRAAGATSVLVDDDAVVAACDQLWDRLRIIVEPAAAAPIAALMTGAWTPPRERARVGVILCGANTVISRG